MTKKAKNLLAILGRVNATVSCIEKVQNVLDTKKKTPQEILDEILDNILFLRGISEEKINRCMDFLTDNLEENMHKFCAKCLLQKSKDDFYSYNGNGYAWCKSCRNEYARDKKRQARGG